MRLNRLALLNFRNYETLSISFFEGVHILYGENGSGKTNILEAIHYLALTKSFRSKTDKHLIRNQEKMFRIQGDFQTSQGQALHSVIAYSAETGKHLTVNQQKVQKFSEYIGEIPLVLLYPVDLNLSQGNPKLRRRFLDILLSQSSNMYLYHLIQYNRSLKQRNLLLSQKNGKHPDLQLLSSWEENLITHGKEIILKRQETIHALSELMTHYYHELSQKEDQARIVYHGTMDGSTAADIQQNYLQAFERKRSQELAGGSTIVGPHRDDLTFLLNGRAMRDYASQGEHKTFIIALKLAEFHYLQQQRHQPPMLLFDDIFGELDARRIRFMLEQLSDIGQVFVTTTSRTFFDKVQAFKIPVHYYQVHSGSITAMPAQA